jgi:hypothetical protein
MYSIGAAMSAKEKYLKWKEANISFVTSFPK